VCPILPAQFFHGSRTHFEVGDVLVPQPCGYVHSADVSEFERIIESRRPEGRLSRFESVFLVADPGLIDAAGGYNEAVYLVEPVGMPEASDLRWYSDAWCEYGSGPGGQARLVEMIDRYWSGEAYPDHGASCFEYRVPEAVVAHVHELNVNIGELEPAHCLAAHSPSAWG
jgi:hypothetical protein